MLGACNPPEGSVEGDVMGNATRKGGIIIHTQFKSIMINRAFSLRFPEINWIYQENCEKCSSPSIPKSLLVETNQGPPPMVWATVISGVILAPGAPVNF